MDLDSGEPGAILVGFTVRCEHVQHARNKPREIARSPVRAGRRNILTLEERPTVTQPQDENVIWLTQEAHDRLRAELEHLTGTVRTELQKRIGEARDEGDLRENGGYHAAKEEQGKVEARIRQLQDMLRRVQVGEQPATPGTVRPGTKVTIKFVGDDDTMTFLLGSRELL